MTPPWWLELLVAVAALLFAGEVGFRLGRRFQPEIAERQKNPVSVMVAALLALLGLLLAFSYSSAGSRFHERRALVLQDANAIGTAYLRAELLPAPHAERVQELLRAYVAVRLSVGHDELPVVLTRSAQLHRQLWDEAVAIDQLEPRAHATPLFVNALNELIDVHEARLTVALYQRLPDPIWEVLFLTALLALGVVGYGAGLGRERAPLATTALVVAVALMLTLIAELDQPVGSSIGVSQRAMSDTAATMTRDREPARDQVGARPAEP